MSLLKLFSGSLVFMVMTSSDPFMTNLDKMKFGLLNDIGLISYIVEIDLHINTEDYSGRCVAEIRTYNEIQFIKIHIKELTMHKTVLNDDKWTYESSMMIHQDIVTIKFNQTMPPGDYSLIMAFSGLMNSYDNGMLKTSYINAEDGDAWFIISRINAFEPQRLFPCWNEPSYKAIFKVAISTPNYYTALSNMRVKEMIKGVTTTWTYFETSRVMSTYLMGIVIFPFPKIPLTGISICSRQNTIPYLKFADTILKNVTLYFSTILETLKRYTLSKVDYVAVPAYAENSLTALGLVLYREADIMYDVKLHSYVHKTNVAYVTARGVAHQFFANLVSPSWWSNLWLIEGIATFYAVDAVQKNFVELRMLDMFVVDMQHGCFDLDIDNLMEPLEDQINDTVVEPILSPSYYIKAPVILRMLQHILTEKVFHEGVVAYIINQFGSANLEDFWATMQTAQKEFGNHTFNIADMMYSYIRRRRYPILQVSRLNITFVRIFVQNIKSLEHGDWFIPLTLSQQSCSDFISKNFTWLKIVPPKTFMLDYPIREKYGWIIINVQQVDYYRVKYDTENWYKIAMFLDSRDHTKIHVLNRAQIIHDAFYFLLRTQINLHLFLEIIKFLPKETDFIVWYPMFKAIEYMTCFFLFSTSTFIKSQIKSLIEKTFFNNNNATEQLDLSESFKAEIVKWKCFFDPTPCATKAIIVIQKDLEKKDKFSLKKKEWIYNIGSKQLDKATWITMFNLYMYKPDSQIFKYLTYSENINNIINFMNMITSPDYRKINIYDRVNSFYSIIERHIRNNEVFVYVLSNFHRLRPKEINTFITLIYIINNLYSEKQLDQLKIWVKRYLTPGTEATYVLTIKHQYFNYKPYFLLEEDRNCENSVRRCIVEYMRQLIMSIITKIDYRIIEINNLMLAFKNFESE